MDDATGTPVSDNGPYHDWWDQFYIVSATAQWCTRQCPIECILTTTDTSHSTELSTTIVSIVATHVVATCRCYPDPYITIEQSSS